MHTNSKEIPNSKEIHTYVIKFNPQSEILEVLQSKPEDMYPLKVFCF